MARWLGGPAVLMAAGIGSYAVADAWGRGAVHAEMVVPQDVPADVRHELDTVWRRFETVFSERRSCIPDVTVVLVADVDGGDARYLADGAVIEIAIPTTPARFRESLAHELAHHVERSCPAFAELRSVLHPVLGGTDLAWSVGAVWYDIPSERWAEHVVELVNGERVRHATDVPIVPNALDAIAAWGARRPLAGFGAQ